MNTVELFAMIPALILLCTLLTVAVQAKEPVQVPVTRNVMDYGAVGDGVTDDSEAIQKCLDDGFNGKWGHPSRIIFPAGKIFKVTHQIVIWAGIQIESDPANPATILLPPATAGYTDPLKPKPVFFSRHTAWRLDHSDKYAVKTVDEKYDYYYLKGNPLEGWPWKWPEEYDNAGTDHIKAGVNASFNNNFWSQIRNLKFHIAPGNPGAIALSWMNAQGAFLYRLDLDLNDAACGIVGGSLIVDCEIRGGRIGVYDPSNQEGGMTLFTRFSRQSECGYGQETFSPRTWIGNSFDNMPVGVRTAAAKSMTMLDCEFRNVSIGIEIPEPRASIFLQNIRSKATPLIYRDPVNSIKGDILGSVLVPTFVNGDIVDGLKHSSGGKLLETTTALPTWSSIPAGFHLEHSAHVKDFGAVGDGKTDDTAALRKAIAARETVYLPAGVYLVSDTVMLRSRTKLVGENTVACRIRCNLDAPAFNDPQNPKPMLDTPDDPDAEVHIAHLHMDPPSNTDGCIGLRWRVGRKSSLLLCGLNAGANPLLITGHGGGTIMGVWTATPGARRGVVVDKNLEPLIFYGLSSEHQTDKSTQFIGAKDVTLYMSSGGEGYYPNHYVINEMTDCERMAWIGIFTNPGLTDENKDRMTVLRMENCNDFWLGQMWRIHSTPVQHSMLATWPDGKELDMKNDNFSFIREGELNNDLGQGAMPELVSTVENSIELVAPVLRVNGSLVKISLKKMPGIDAVRMIRRFDRAPQTPDDGELVYEGSETEYSDDTQRDSGIAWYGFFGKKGGTYTKGLSARVSLGDASCVSQWLVLGPFDAPDRNCRKAYDEAFIDEVNIEPEAGMKTGTLEWTPVGEESMRADFVDFLAFFKDKKTADLVQKAVYMSSWIYSPSDVDCSLFVGADDGFNVWLNDTVVGGENRLGVATKDEYTYPVKMKKGWNRLLIKVTQGGGNWLAGARFAMPDGSPLAVTIRDAREKGRQTVAHP